MRTYCPLVFSSTRGWLVRRPLRPCAGSPVPSARKRSASGCVIDGRSRHNRKPGIGPLGARAALAGKEGDLVGGLRGLPSNAEGRQVPRPRPAIYPATSKPPAAAGCHQRGRRSGHRSDQEPGHRRRPAGVAAGTAVVSRVGSGRHRHSAAGPTPAHPDVAGAPNATTASMVSTSSTALSSRYRSTRANRRATPPG